MRTTIKRTYIRGGGASGPIYYVPVRNDLPPVNTKFVQETITESFDGGTNIFELSHTVGDSNIFVYFNGVLQEPDVFIVTGSTLTILSTVPEGWKIDVVYTISR